MLIGRIGQFQLYLPGINRYFSGMFEIHGHPVACDRLNLPNTPTGLARMCNECARNQKHATPQPDPAQNAK